MKKSSIVRNDGTLLFHIIKHVKKEAENNAMENFVCWYVSKMIIPYCDKLGKEFQQSFYNSIGFKKEPSIDKVYLRLRELTLIN